MRSGHKRDWHYRSIRSRRRRVVDPTDCRNPPRSAPRQLKDKVCKAALSQGIGVLDVTQAAVVIRPDRLAVPYRAETLQDVIPVVHNDIRRWPASGNRIVDSKQTGPIRRLLHGKPALQLAHELTIPVERAHPRLAGSTVIEGLEVEQRLWRTGPRCPIENGAVVCQVGQG